MIDKAELLQLLTDVESAINAAHAHECAGWQCAECAIQAPDLRSRVLDALAKLQERPAKPVMQKLVHRQVSFTNPRVVTLWAPQEALADFAQFGELGGDSAGNTWINLDPRYNRDEVLAYIDNWQPAQPAPVVVCLCGSTRFASEFQRANERETLAGRIVLSIGVNMRDPHIQQMTLPENTKEQLDALHFAKIRMADQILVVDVGQFVTESYIGDSTRREIEYARSLGKPVRWLSEELRRA